MSLWKNLFGKKEKREIRVFISSTFRDMMLERDLLVKPEDFIFQHYFGATPESASPEGFLRRPMGELKDRLACPPEHIIVFSSYRGPSPTLAEKKTSRLRTSPKRFSIEVWIRTSGDRKEANWTLLP